MITLGAIATVCALALAVIAANPRVLDDPVPPRDGAPLLIGWLARHPADLDTARRIANDVLDSDLPNRRAIWRGAYEHAERLAPRVPDAAIAYVRAGLFHWKELENDDRREILRVAEPLLGDPKNFRPLHRPVWQLTHDFGYLRRVAPRDPGSLEALQDLAIAYGLFDEYRELRGAVRGVRLKALQETRSEARIRSLIDLLPERLSTDDEPLARVLLEELDRRPVDLAQLDGRLAELARYAIEHDVAPLGGLEPLVTQRILRDPLRARIALALGDIRAATRIEISATQDGPLWDRYFLERALHEAKAGEAAMADAYLRRAAAREESEAVLATGAEIGRMTGNAAMTRVYERQLASSRRPPEWTGTCAPNEVCDFARTRMHVSGQRALGITLENVQSDETPPWAEIYVDDALVAEGPVETKRTFDLPAAPGLRTVEVRLVNPLTRGGVQRRLRLSRSMPETAAPRRTASVAGFDGMKKLKSKSA
jgi:hypothetical protein